MSKRQDTINQVASCLYYGASCTFGVALVLAYYTALTAAL